MSRLPLLLLALAVGLPAQDAYATEKARRAAQAVPDLARLAEEAREDRCYGLCIRAWQLVVALDPEHEEARRLLRYEKDGSGRWVRGEDFEVPRDFDEKAAARHAEDFEALRAPLVTEWITLLESETGRALAEDRRRAEIRLLLEVAPDDRRVRELLDIFTPRERADLLEGLAGGRSREGLRELAQLFRAHADLVRDVPLTPIEEKLGITFPGRVRAGGVRVLTTGGREEAADVARRAAATVELFARITGTRVAPPRGFTLYLITNAHARRQFISAHPSLGEAQRNALKGLMSTWVGGLSGIADWSPDAERRRDGCVRGVIAALFTKGFGLTVDHAWAWEGLGIHLTEIVCGTRLTWYVRPGDYAVGADPLRERMMQVGVDWAGLAREGLEKERLPPYPETLSRTIETMSDRHLLAGWAFAAWLIEVRPELVTPILRRLEEPAATPEIVSEILGFPVTELPQRLERWLGRR